MLQPFKVKDALKNALHARKNNDYKKADILYKVILNIYPENPDANYNMGLLAIEINRHQEAITFFEKAIKSNPKNQKYWLSYLEIALFCDDIKLAEKLLLDTKTNNLPISYIKKLEQKLVNYKVKAIINNQFTILFDMYKNEHVEQAYTKGLGF